MNPYISLLFCVILSSCSNSKVGDLPIAEIPVNKPLNESIGKWTNVHSSNRDLAGVLVQQFPDSLLESPAWEGGHPAMILFVMWDGRVNQIGYEPSGKKSEDFWWNIEGDSRDYSYIWKQLDYTQGVDPLFKNHKDPR